ELTNFPTVNNIRVQRIGCNIPVLFRAHRMPVPEADRSIVAPALYAGRSALLLSAVHPVSNAIVGNHVIELRCRLVVPGTPDFPAIDVFFNDSVDTEKDNVRILRIDPYT